MGVNKGYISVLKNLKIKIRNARLRAAITVNTELLELYWEIGNAISEQQQLEGWGTKVIEKLALDLKLEFPGFKGLSARNLRYMRDFAEAWPREPLPNYNIIIINHLYFCNHWLPKLPGPIILFC